MAIKETLPFNFDDIYAFVETKFNEKGYDVQEGSNSMQLVTAMSYLVSMLNANTAVNINETLLTLARKRATVLQDARVLGYEIAHKQSYQYDLSLTLTNTTAVNVTQQIVKYTSFTSNGKTYYYMGEGFDVTVPALGTYTFTLRVKEGILKKYQDEPTLNVVIDNVYNNLTQTWSAQTYVDVPFTNIEDDGIEMFITAYDEFGDLQISQWFRSEQFMIDKDTVLNKEFVRLDNIEYKTPRLHFKLGDVGKDIRIGSIVQMNVLESSGANGAMVSAPTPSALPATVNSYTIAIQGADEEGIESIRNNAPLFYNSANRLVTRPDYVSFINRQPSVKYSDVWDGNLEFPPKAGYVWFSFVPATLNRVISDAAAPGITWTMQNTYDFVNWYIEDTEIQSVYTNMNKYKIPTLQFIHRHPIYFDFEYDVKIARYSVNTTRSEINTDCFNIINDYFRDGDTSALINPDTDTVAVETYNFEYFQSNLIKRIDRNLTDITGFDITLTTSIPLTTKNILTNETLNGAGPDYLHEIEFHLGVPFDGVINPDTTVNYANLPVIDTDNFINDQTLYTDFDPAGIVISGGLTRMPVKLTALGAAGVKAPLTDLVVGEYSVINTSYQDIEITLFVISAGGYTEGFAASDFDLVYLDAPTNTIIDEVNSGVRMNIVYPTPNIPFTRNTLPRLKKVNFI